MNGQDIDNILGKYAVLDEDAYKLKSPKDLGTAALVGATVGGVSGAFLPRAGKSRLGSSLLAAALVGGGTTAITGINPILNRIFFPPRYEKTAGYVTVPAGSDYSKKLESKGARPLSATEQADYARKSLIATENRKDITKKVYNSKIKEQAAKGYLSGTVLGAGLGALSLLQGK